MKKIIMLLVIIGLFSCQKSINEIPQNNLVGIWRLTSYCKPTGAMSCVPIIVPNDKKVFISFTNKKEFKEWYENTRPIDYSFLGCGGGSYEIEGNGVRIRAGCMSSIAGQYYPIVSVTASKLVLNPFGTGDYVFEK